MSNIVETVQEQLTLENVLMATLKTPGVKIDRAKFLRKELLKYVPEKQLREAIKGNPAKAEISKEIINKVSKQVIDYETTKVTGISVAASIPGGAAAVAAATGDIAAYFAFILRTVQELAYLYGFEQFNLDEDEFDSESMQHIMVFMGVMFGVQGATSAL